MRLPLRATLALALLLPATVASADPLTCPVLANLGSAGGAGTVNAQGDVFVGGQMVWDCPPYGDGSPPPSPAPIPATGHITIHRFPNEEPLFLAAPVAEYGPWQCYDVNTGQPVREGDALRSPNPGVLCTPPAWHSDECHSVQSNGYYTAGAGAIIVTSACNGLQASTPLSLGQSGSSGPVTGNGRTPWACQVQEFLVNPALTDYWVFCHINVP